MPSYNRTAILNQVESSSLRAAPLEFAIGDTVNVHTRILEGEKERIQIFEGIVIAVRHGGIAKNITVRKLSSAIGVERTFPVHSPNVAKFEVIRRGKVRRAKLYYLRDKVGKAARIEEKR